MPGVLSAAQGTEARGWAMIGAGAGLHSAERADALQALGGLDGRAVWHRIEHAIGELQRSAPGDGEGVH